MTKTQVILLAGAVMMVVMLYLFVPTASKKNQQATAVAAGDQAAEKTTDFDITAYRDAQISTLTEAIRQAIDKTEESVAQGDSAEVANALENQRKIFLEQRLPLLAADASERLAQRHQTAANWYQAGNMYRITAMSEDNKVEIIKYAWAQAVACYQKAVAEAPDNLDYKINLASALMEQGENTMKGVQMLLSIVEQHPDNIPANLILGKFGIVSGQYEKAVARLEKVVQLDPKNTEAYFYLAEAYHGLGRKDDAIRTFEICKKLVDDPGFSAEIDQYILKIKNT